MNAEETLKQIAYITDGEYFRAGTGADLERIYSTLSTELIVERERTEITALGTALSALLVLVAGVLSLVWFRRIA